MVPDCICAGFQKSGTTTLYSLLLQNPYLQFAAGGVKEPKYYNKDFRLSKKGFQWYESHYYGNIKDNEKKVIEINTRLFGKEITRQISEDFGKKLKLIFIMRNPVERCFSAYKFLVPRVHICQGGKIRDVIAVKEKGYSSAFEEYVKNSLFNKNNRIKINRNREPLEYFSGGLYYKHISEYLKYYDISNMRFYLFEDFIKDQKHIVEDIFDFLEVPHFQKISYGLKTNDTLICPKDIGKSVEFQFVHFFHNYLVQRIGYEHPFTNFLEKLDFYLENLSRQAHFVVEEKVSMTDETRRILKKFYRKDVERLQQLTKLDLKKKWKF